MIIQTSMRTDIPAFYSQWFQNRLREGYVLVRNPYHPKMVTKYRLNPEVVDLIVFCTKDPSPMFPYQDILNPYGQYWFVTITPYGKEIEPNVPAKEIVMKDLKRLSQTVGINCVAWRYDPIFISDVYTLERHIFDFEEMAKNLSGYTKTCIISFIDIYKKVQRNFPEAKSVSKEDREQLGKAFADIGKKYGMVIKSCGEGNELAACGVDCEGCMTLEIFEKALQGRLDAPKDKSLRTECACYFGKDIGAYNSCGNLCRYCYANYDARTVRQNLESHNPDSPFLLGNIQIGDEIHEAKQKKWLDMQMSLKFE